MGTTTTTTTTTMPTTVEETTLAARETTTTSSESVAPIPVIENIGLSSGALPSQIEDDDQTEIIEGFSDVAPLPFDIVGDSDIMDSEEDNDSMGPIQVPNKLGKVTSIFDPIGDDDSETDLFSGDGSFDILEI